MSPDFFTISQLNQFIRDVINAGFPQPLWVCGEIQQFDRNKGKKHIFFELVEKDADSHEVKARIGLVIFAGQKDIIQQILAKSENAFELKDDIEVKFACRVDFYPPHGAVRLIVESIDPTYTLGKIAQERQKLITLLKEKVVLEKNKKLELPLVPLNVGLITAHDSAAYNDFLAELKHSGFGFSIFCRNTLMQGKGAERDVCQALQELARRESLDVIVITRGGGSIAELSCFDSAQIAETIAASPLPVLSGIGHEINTTITDLAAHTYMKTPTAIAQFLVNRVAEFREALDERLRTISELAQERIEHQKQRLKNRALFLQNQTRQFLKSHQERLIQIQEIMKQQPRVRLKDFRRHLEAERERLTKTIEGRLVNDRKRLDHCEKIIKIIHPVHTLRRGFSITRLKNGKVLKSISDTPVGETLTTELVDGMIESEVTDARSQIQQSHRTAGRNY